MHNVLYTVSDFLKKKNAIADIMPSGFILGLFLSWALSLACGRGGVWVTAIHGFGLYSVSWKARTSGHDLLSFLIGRYWELSVLLDGIGNWRGRVDSDREITPLQLKHLQEILTLVPQKQWHLPHLVKEVVQMVCHRWRLRLLDRSE